MIADLEPYPAVRESGVRWLGEVPEHWDVDRLGTSVRGCINGVWGNDPNGRDDLPCVRVADFDRGRLRVRLAKPTIRAIAPGERNRRLLKTGDLLLEKSGGGDLQPVGVVMLYDHDVRAVCSNFVARMPVAAGFDSGFLTYLHSHLYAIGLNIRSIKQTTGIQNLDSSSYLNEAVAFPPLPEQAAIVRFLDYVERRIRRFIRARKKLVKLLEEQKQAVIHRTVTRGLDLNGRRKPSGVDWLGDVPEHWEVVALRRRWSVTDCKHLTVPFVENEDGIPLASVREVQAFDLSLATAKRTSRESYQSLIEGGRRPRNGDLIYCRNVSVGAAAVVNTDEPLAMGQDVCLIRSSGENQRYLNYFLRSPAMSHQLSILLVGSTFNRINVADIKTLTIVVPTRKEQDAIADFLDAELKEVARAQALAAREISLLREYRTRLIADVVTGKVDVREAAARLPDEAEEPEPLDEVDDPTSAEDEAVDDLDAIPEEAEA